MAVLPIRISGDPVLHSPALPVTDFGPALATLVSDMFETMDAAPGVGLAAPQVGVPLRLFTFSWTDDDGIEHRGVAINPVLWISPAPVADDEDEYEPDEEGCLSFPGERFPLLRSADALLRAFDLDQNPFELQTEGWLARIFQHEFDHLEGHLYIDRLERNYARQASRIARKKSWLSPGTSWLPGVDRLED
jgi:peptide deformylase